MLLGFGKVEEEIIEVGDVVITRCGESFLILHDCDVQDFRAVNLEKNRVTDFWSSIHNLVGHIESEYSAIERIIKAKNLKLMEV